MKAFVYVISGEHGRQKIGCSDNPKQRLKELQTGSPYPLKFEFIGEAENRSAGQIEVEAHFTLNAHKAQGGDEWFTVPSDVAITAVMAAAHRLGYRIRPVDIDAVITPTFFVSGAAWEKWLKAAVALVALYPIWQLILMLDDGKIGVPAFIVTGFVLILCIIVAQWIAVMAARGFYAIYDAAARFMDPFPLKEP